MATEEAFKFVYVPKVMRKPVMGGNGNTVYETFFHTNVSLPKCVSRFKNKTINLDPDG